MLKFPAAFDIDPRTGRPACLSYDDALRTLRDCIAALLPGADPSLYGLHSLRIGAASALFALNCPPLVLQSLGRWQSDIYELYCRANRAQLVQWTSRIGTAQYTTLEEMAWLAGAGASAPTRCARVAV